MIVLKEDNMKLSGIKRIFSIFFVVVSISLLFTACPKELNSPPYGPYIGWKRYGIVHLTVLAPDGEPAIKDIDSERFRIQFSGRNSYVKDQSIINAEDRLIYILGKIPIYCEDAKKITDEDIKKALDNEDLDFAIRDTRDIYKTVIATYKECYKDHKKRKGNKEDYYADTVDYIYNCEIKLTKK